MIDIICELVFESPGVEWKGSPIQLHIPLPIRCLQCLNSFGPRCLLFL